MKSSGLILFTTTTKAISAEKILSKSFKIDMIPTPTQITDSCGICLIFDPSLIDEVKALMAEEQVDFKGLYLMTGDRRNKQIEEV